jgi:hypothetical protein
MTDDQMQQAREYVANAHSGKEAAPAAIIDSDARIAQLESENARLREILAMCADDLEEEIEARRAGELPRRIERDLHTVRLARAALKGEA